MSYLTNRQQFMELNGIYSSTLPIEYGVPQDSLLGPRLYTIYVNDFPGFVSTGNVLMYANDITLYYMGPNVEHVICSMNSVMDQISLWSMRNKLTIHIAKTDAMILRKSPFIGPIQPRCFGSGFFKTITFTTCLGVTIDNNLSWSIYMEKVKNNCSKQLGALRRMKHLPKYVLQDIYFKAVIPCVTYAISVWGNCSSLLFNH